LLSAVGSVRVINYKDKTVQKLRLTELSGMRTLSVHTRVLGRFGLMVDG
jgi:hypothetical protein